MIGPGRARTAVALNVAVGALMVSTVVSIGSRVPVSGGLAPGVETYAKAVRKASAFHPA
jgi:hypothetical protein